MYVSWKVGGGSICKEEVRRSRCIILEKVGTIAVERMGGVAIEGILYVPWRIVPVSKGLVQLYWFGESSGVSEL